MSERGYKGYVYSDAIIEGTQGTSSLLHRWTANKVNVREGGNNPDSTTLFLVLFLRTGADRLALIPGRTVWQIFLKWGEEGCGRMKIIILIAAAAAAAAT